MTDTLENVKTAEINSTKDVLVDGVSTDKTSFVTTASAQETTISSETTTAPADDLTTMLAEATALCVDERSKSISREEASARFAAYLVKLGGRYHFDADFRVALDTQCVERRIPLASIPGSLQYVEDIKKGNNPINEFLPVVKLVDGHWVDKLNRFGRQVTDEHGVVQVWQHNRSLEKYAPFIEFCIRNSLSADEIYKILVNGGDFEIKGEKVKATITAIIAFNAKQKGALSRKPTVWKPEVRAAAAQIKPIFSLELSLEQKKALTEGDRRIFTLSEDGYAAAIIRINASQLEILGDFHVTGNPLLDKVRSRTPDMVWRNAHFLDAKTEENS